VSANLLPWLPLIVLFVAGFWGARIQRAARKLKIPPNPRWPFAQNPGLALELAVSAQFVSDVLGEPATEPGIKNRQVAASLQKLDFVFIPLYAAFFVVAAAAIATWPRCWPVVIGAVLTAVFDYMEDFRILGIIGHKPSPRAPKPIGQLKWLFYFLTLGAEGILVWGMTIPSAARSVAGLVLVALLIGNAIGGVISSIKGSFTGILSATKLSMLGLLLLALAPLIAIAPFSWRTVALYGVLLRVPLITAILLLTLPIIAFFAAPSLLRGLFDLTPWSVFVVSLTTLAAAGSAVMASHIVFAGGPLRFGLPAWEWWMPAVGSMFVVSLPIIAISVIFSARQRHGLVRCLAGALGGAGVALGLTEAVLAWSHSNPLGAQFPQMLANTGLFSGYVEAPADHFLASFGLLVTLAVYTVVGIYGYLKLGRKRTVPALCSALMLVTLLTWMLAGVSFFFDLWRIPILLIIVAVGTLTAQSVRSDHFYKLRPRSPDPAPSAAETIKAAKSARVIVAAANGGGIQAGAWAAQVLYGLEQDCGEAFRSSLRMISSVSGGSVGNAMYVHSLASREEAQRPDKAAAESSIDEVAWGLGWPDFLRALLPWLFGFLVKIGRGRALERAWRMNSASDASSRSNLDESLSSWNRRVAAGGIPAVVMNATISETGERLLLATTEIRGGSTEGKARVNARDLHRINGTEWDVSVATAARLSASFPYVTPAARSDGPGPQPHVVDGGYYDNYGMATMVEWLDEALTGASGVKEVLVIQIHGAPVGVDATEQRHEQTRGWFYQAIAPLTTLAAVRAAGQLAHNEIELDLLRQKWADKDVTIDSVTFEFSNPNAPLSWHLTPQEIDAISAEWNGPKMAPCRQRVKNFLAAGGR
jgi:hypothetical protein